MKPLYVLLATFALGLGAVGCGGGSKAPAGAKAATASAGGSTSTGALSGTSSGASSSPGAGASAGSTTAAATGGTQAAGSAVVSHGLKGDEDDDDTATTTKPGNSTGDNDADFDNDLTDNRGKGYRDGDDAPIVGFGKPASPPDSRAIAALAIRYYAAAAASDGSTACRLMYSILEEAIVEDYGSGAGPSYARGKSCSEVMTKIFAHAHAQLTGHFQVTDVRIKGNQAYALMGSHTQPATYLSIHRERVTWKVQALLGGPLP